MLVKLVEHMEKEKVFHFALTHRTDGDYASFYEFGQEAPDSPMYGGASYGIGTIDECLYQHMKDLRLNVV